MKMNTDKIIASARSPKTYVAHWVARCSHPGCTSTIELDVPMIQEKRIVKIDEKREIKQTHFVCALAGMPENWNPRAIDICCAEHRSNLQWLLKLGR